MESGALHEADPEQQGRGKEGTLRVQLAAPEGSCFCMHRRVCGEEDDVATEGISRGLGDVAHVCFIGPDEAELVLYLRTRSEQEELLWVDQNLNKTGLFSCMRNSKACSYPTLSTAQQHPLDTCASTQDAGCELGGR